MSKEKAIEEIRNVALKYLPNDDYSDLCQGQDSLDELDCFISKHLNPYGKSINLFVVDESNLINCWLGDLIEESAESRTVWGQAIFFKTKIFDHLVINDYMSWITQGQDAYEVGTKDGIIYFNNTAIRVRASEVWKFLTKVNSGELKHRYDALKSNKLRKKLMNKAWHNLYLDCIEKHQNIDEAKKVFIKRYIELKKENSFYHELGHQFAVLSGKEMNDIDEEMISILTELRYGSVPYDSMDFLVSAAWANEKTSYNLAGRSILKLMVDKIEENPPDNFLEVISYKKSKLTEKIRPYYKLTERQIRDISEEIFNELITPALSLSNY